MRVLTKAVLVQTHVRQDFEDTCKELNTELLVLPPASPIYNGGVERSNGMFRTEFYDNPNLLEDSIGR
jgi:hypothetical protein